jgi:methylenetetrahydrofolate dehydrogenase (NADP+)/methenyltetrahydrofolate cyclohydrolase
VTANLLDGKKLSAQIREELRDEVAEFIENNGEVPTLATVLVGDDPASQVYVRNKVSGCEQVGMQSKQFRLPAETTTEDLLTLVAKLNKAAEEPIHGILVQLPLPKQVDTMRVLNAVSPLKDVDGFHPENIGRMVQGNPRFLPCTPYGIQQLLVRNNIETVGRRVVVVGRSETVGKPMALLLMQRGKGGDATVTVCHSKTPDLGRGGRRGDASARRQALRRRRFRRRQPGGRTDHPGARRRGAVDGDDVVGEHAGGGAVAEQLVGPRLRGVVAG